MYLFITAEILDGSKKPQITAIGIEFQHKYYEKNRCCNPATVSLSF